MSDSGARVVHVLNAAFALQYIRGQSAYMRERGGLEVSVVTPPSPRLQEFGRAEGVPVFAVDLPRRITPLQDLRAVARLVRFFRAVRPAIVHGHTPKGGLLGMLAATLARVPGRVYTLHGLVHLTASGSTRRLLMTSDRMACALADRVICVSASVRQVAIEEGICPADKVVVLGSGSANGIDAESVFNPTVVENAARHNVRERHGIGAQELVVGFVGRIVRDKGIEPLADAWERLRQSYPCSRLMVIGPEEVRDPVPAAVLEALRQDPAVIMVGEEYNLAPHLAAMDLLVLPTYREGLPTVLLEAAAMELPVVATRIPGCVDAVVDGVTGTLVPPGDSGALAAAIERYLLDDALRRRHGRAGRERVLQQFRPRDVWEGIYGEYSKLLGVSDVEPAAADLNGHL